MSHQNEQGTVDLAQAPNKGVAMVIKLQSFFFANPKSEVADLCKSMLVNVCQILSIYEGYLLLQ